MSIEILENKLKEIMYPTKELTHGEETVKWLLRICPSVDWQVKIAALSHDIERAVSDIPGMTPPKPSSEGEKYEIYKEKHAQRSAEIVSHIMRKLGFLSKDIERVVNIIAKHEVGGDVDSDLVRDADSIQWFDTGWINYKEKYGIEGAKEKGLWMYKRANEMTKKLIDSLPFSEEIRGHITNHS